MKRFWMLLTIALTSASLFAATAEAKRFGGGGSIGKQRTMTPQQAPKAPAATPAQTPSQTPAAAPASAGNKWLGPLAGLAIGAGLGALFASMGLGEGMGTILMIILGGMAVMFLISMLRKKQHQPAMQYAGAGAPYNEPQPVRQPLAGTAINTAQAKSSESIPADFPVESFLRSAKTSFIRLQAANDRKDLNDIREYTTPEMFAEISMQMQERDDAPQKTDVIAINGELLEVAEENDWAIATVRFTGQLRESNGTPESVDEIWHVQKNLRDDKSVWLLAGIQQTTLH
jgi:predicted lipid-binding transport protein (Tim44 family)